MEKSIIFIGGGPAGYEGAIRAAMLGAKVTIIEKEDVGGTCLNRGCIPTKALYKNAEVLKDIKNAEEFGYKIDNYSIDFEKIMERKDNVVSKLRDGILMILKSYNIDLIYGNASFIDEKILLVKTIDKSFEISADIIIIATGSSPIIPKVDGVELGGVITSRELLSLKAIPKTLTIAGGGVIGLEFANIFNELGTEVTIISNALLKRVDKELSKRVTMMVKKQGIKFLAKSHLEKIEESENGLKIYTTNEKNKVVDSDLLLLAMGRVANFEGLNIENAHIKFDRKGIIVDDDFKTSTEGIYAVGDVIGKKMLAHVASNQAIYLVEKLLDGKSHIDLETVPDCVFISPEVATVGMTEEECKESNIEYSKNKFLFGANGKALALNEPDGFVKVLAEKTTNKILGVHIMGPHASDLIMEGTLAISNNFSASDIGKTIHPHPTLSESFLEASLGIVDEAIHRVKSKR
ncbi:dihydrolipoyl dehydrogenase [Helicovermis profundi]|uniref:Dihydrolipoyl dehydrogenase n=1 Tax=Helicovermis profundi TaxID=3065157 RepID=A0AAU9E507_9FIRM|nr:dihydrolipoyl dehydrogenase [Clostridia bacterium S502]